MQEPQSESKLRHDVASSTALFDSACGKYFGAIGRNNGHNVLEIRRQARLTGNQCKTAIGALLGHLKSLDNRDLNEIKHVELLMKMVSFKLSRIPEK
jgi:hypothetical protein